MPTYILTNTKTNKTYEEFCSWDNLQTILKDNPHLKQELTTAALVGDHVASGNPSGKGMDGGMKEVFGKIAQNHPNSPLADRFGDGKNVRQKKVKTVAKKHGII
jgi:ribosomal protein L15|tara:strand:- start:110 stop:421 length:312 start_codon:yes stop_codon:yes gene_type:complete